MQHTASHHASGQMPSLLALWRGQHAKHGPGNLKHAWLSAYSLHAISCLLQKKEHAAMDSPGSTNGAGRPTTPEPTIPRPIAAEMSIANSESKNDGARPITPRAHAAYTTAMNSQESKTGGCRPATPRSAANHMLMNAAARAHTRQLHGRTAGKFERLHIDYTSRNKSIGNENLLIIDELFQSCFTCVFC